ncbi:MAG: hypothetical protein UX85_C0003G0155 [Candidatus Beckwithbacteria bacterium GW2011_GWB1_47_15]|uniref:Uncharacterized protein n=1 Tax=Candidatus Beckwithbacteria bacterium GW2011_GWB1_47_15 TaxID=1618371 RepID=A0A0G1RWJ8_9BACT|nr:MAG: hypothetical protein UY43_C0001G0304 [Candidatus Beckwithbacteria bacterium GW2011_GWC1_49_16]KKU35226.1 MAG: hypothetical protein UX50_C0005G0049 [Candidatus Beckwithbacteria bacterium GW2011_GWA1_46_30]KKU61496.1 MAG: hypothetical protein UX85_C0003G0155 [Candidatus Beckwithbacteria bacterium GW2011_GWB1_47_15]KKU71700.1 MAG: hypothetical protein UX97_C0004G0023 [Candidatus Beckwithbacteria bacterium GW2011_GWA2_47_25]KKW03798.1 MAG: hypothetical protein UY37_C0004G0091 [Candidatus Be
MPTDKHELPPESLDLKQALHEERHMLEDVETPVVTVSATYRKELAYKYQTLVHAASDVVFSRAHYSMAEAVVRASTLLGRAAHMADPTNFVSHRDWQKVQFTEKVGQLMARSKILKWVKDKVDTVARNQLPINQAITPPLIYLTGRVRCPVVSLHYEVGNILVENGREVVQVVTDPHVRPQYLTCLPSDKITYCVFDERTKKDLLKQARKMGKNIKRGQVAVTGPPVDPRIVRLGRSVKDLGKNEMVNLAVATGGLGTNMDEIRQILDQLVPLLKPPAKIRLFLYAGTHRDFRALFEDYAEDNGVRIGNLDDELAPIRILYEDSIIDANNNLIRYMFPWAHGVVTKPSGDMAYDAAAAGCFLLFLKPWGEWEENIQKRFVKRRVGYDFPPEDALEHFKSLWSRGLLNSAMSRARRLPKIFREGAKNIVRVHQGKPCRV